MTRPSDLEKLAAHHAAMEAELAEQQRELARSRELLDDARRRRHLPTIADIRVDSPCRADWSRMVGDERVRHCGECKQYVYDLSAMTRAEAEALIGSLEHAPCVRYYQRADGTILFSDCAVVRSSRRRGRAAAASLVLAAGAGIAHILGLPPEPREPESGLELTMGLMRIEDPELYEPEAESPEPDLYHEMKGMIGYHSQAPPPEPVPEEVARARAVEQAEAVVHRARSAAWRAPAPDPSFLRVYREAIPDDEE